MSSTGVCASLLASLWIVIYIMKDMRTHFLSVEAYERAVGA